MHSLNFWCKSKVMIPQSPLEGIDIVAVRVGLQKGIFGELMFIKFRGKFPIPKSVALQFDK